MTITYRSVKGSNLTATEVDDNFHDVDDRITELEDNPPEPVNISNITVVGTQMTIYLEDATEFGPFTLPQANFRPSVVATVATDTYAPVLADANSYKRCTHADGCTVTVPLNSAVAFPVDTELTYRQAADEPIIFDTLTDGPTLNGIVGYLNMTGGRGA
ncbi:MAG: hypothetical protein EOS20_18710, partial [Mesorhizobium sp.]|uniref:hypothetical protein n=1 Tax=Mesorhizobium sp. TaxID=1871066 RepID=UPI000FE79A3E